MGLFSTYVEVKFYKHCTALSSLHSVAVNVIDFFSRLSNKYILPK